MPGALSLGRRARAAASTPAFPTSLLIPSEASGLAEAHRGVNTDHASVRRPRRPLAWGTAPGDSSVSCPVQQLAFESRRPCALGAPGAAVDGRVDGPFRAARAADGRVSAPARPVAPVLAAGSLPQRLGPQLGEKGRTCSLARTAPHISFPVVSGPSPRGWSRVAGGAGARCPCRLAGEEASERGPRVATVPFSAGPCVPYGPGRPRQAVRPKAGMLPVLSSNSEEPH